MPERHTLLVVDDEPDVVKSVQDLLRLDYRVLGATRAEEALRILDRDAVHVVMSDQRMPEMTGVEFLRRVRDEHPDIVRLLFTGYADVRAVIDAINEGDVYRYVTKPWDPDELQAVIRGAVARHDLLAERRGLLDELKQKNEELEAANAGLKRANDLKLAFIEVASHELRTPLTILLGMTKLLADTPELPDPLPDWLERIHASSERLQHLVEQMVAMLEAGQFQQKLERKRVNLSDLLNQSANDVRPFVQMRRQFLELDWYEDLGTIVLDASKIRDCINHLLLNAIKFTPDGGTITITPRRTENGGAEIRVRDTGEGIAPEIRPHLFEPFFTGFDAAHHTSGLFEYKRKGLGLGLSVVKAFVEMHGGAIAAESEPGEGTAFTITLPASPRPPADPASVLLAQPLPA